MIQLVREATIQTGSHTEAPVIYSTYINMLWYMNRSYTRSLLERANRMRQ